MEKAKQKKAKQVKQKRVVKEPKQVTLVELSEKEKTKQELKDLSKDAVMLADGVIQIAKGIFKVLYAFVKMLFFALKFSLDGLGMIFKGGKKNESKKGTSKGFMAWVED